MRRVFSRLPLIALAALLALPARAAQPEVQPQPQPEREFAPRSIPQEPGPTRRPRLTEDLTPAADSLGLSAVTGAPRSGSVLKLADVIDSVERHDPRLAGAAEAIRGAGGQMLAAQGAYDPRVRARGVIEPFYRNAVFDLRVEQPTPLWGITAWAGYQLGVGRRPFRNNVVDGVLDIDDRVGGRNLRSAGGELAAGITVPLWRDGRIDRGRANIRQSKMERDRLGDVRDARLLALELEAATVYWSWVASGLQLEIEHTLLDLAIARDDALKRQIELGAIDPLAGVDNKRLILDREGRVVTAERAFQADALALSIYLRDGQGDPQIPGAERLPQRLPDMPRPEATDIPAQIADAQQRRPDRRALLTNRDQGHIELRWAKNQRAPRVDVSAWAGQQFGRQFYPDQPRTSFVTAVMIELPIPLRSARGQVESTRASLGMLEADLRLLDDQIAVQVVDAHSAVLAAYQRARLAAQEVELTQTLASAEYRRFQLGASTMMFVNLRELASADAATANVRAVADYLVAKAGLEVATGEGVQPVAP